MIKTWLIIILIYLSSELVVAGIDLDEFEDENKEKRLRPTTSKPSTSIRLEVSNQTFIENVNVTFTCSISCTEGPVNISWYVDMQERKDDTIKQTEYNALLYSPLNVSYYCMSVSQFSFKPSYRQNETNVTCATSDGILSKTFISNATYYKPRKLVFNTSRIFQRGNELILPCIFDVNSPAKIEWYFNGSLVNKSDPNIVITKPFKNNNILQTNLSIPDAMERNSGLYKCEIITSEFRNNIQYSVKIHNFIAAYLNENCVNDTECQEKDINSYCSSICKCKEDFVEVNKSCRKKDEDTSSDSSDFLKSTAFNTLLGFTAAMFFLLAVVFIAYLLRRCQAVKRQQRLGLSTDYGQPSITMITTPGEIPDIPFFAISPSENASGYDLSPPRYEDVIKESEPPPKYSFDMKPKGQKFSLIVHPRERFRSIVRHVAMLLNVGEISRTNEPSNNTSTSSQSTTNLPVETKLELRY